MQRFSLSLILILALSQSAGAAIETQTAFLGPYTVVKKGHAIGIEKSQGGEIITLLKSTDQFLQSGHLRLKTEENRASFQLSPKYIDSCDTQFIDDFVSTPKQIRMTGVLKGANCQIPFKMTFFMSSLGHLSVRADVEGQDAFIQWHVPSEPFEDFYGAGVQPSLLKLNGHVLPMVSQEGGIGRGEPVITPWVNALSKGSGGHKTSSYSPAPVVMSNLKRGYYSQSTALGNLDLSDSHQTIFDVFSNHDTLSFFSSPTPLGLVSEWTAYHGRPQMMPDWLHKGAQVGIQGGTEKVRAIWGKLQAQKTPLSAFWLQDWVGKRKTSIGSQLWWNWELDKKQYPQWNALSQGLAQSGIALMGYINPFLVDAQAKGAFERNLYSEAKSKGFLVKDNHGEPYKIKNTDFAAGLVDLSHPEARKWMKKIIQKQLIGTGFKGWMADYGEALPMDAKLYKGDVKTAHNAYPLWWAEVNQSAIKDSGQKNLTFFTRSGFSQSSRFSPYYWTGDQMVNWDGFDGFQSSLIALLSGGVSGFAINHSDIGGYTSIFHSPSKMGLKREKELLYRWTEANAFTSIFRTHEGNQPEVNQQFYSSDENLAFFSRMSKIYAALFLYRKTLFKEAKNKGWPVVRPLWLHYPKDKTVSDLKSQWLLGKEFLIAPVMEPKKRDASVYLPNGVWRHLWSQGTFDSKGEWVKVEAPLGYPPVFYLESSIVGQRFYSDLKQKQLLD